MSQQSDNSHKNNNSFLVGYGTAIFGFSILILSLPDMNELFLGFTRIMLILSAILGVLSLFPRPWKFLHHKIFIVVITNIVFLAWLFGFVSGWLNGFNEISEPWNIITFCIGYLWLFVILLLISRSTVVVSEKRRALRWTLPWAIPFALAIMVIRNFIEGEWFVGLILLAVTVISSSIATGKLKPMGTIPGLMD